MEFLLPLFDFFPFGLVLVLPSDMLTVLQQVMLLWHQNSEMLSLERSPCPFCRHLLPAGEDFFFVTLGFPLAIPHPSPVIIFYTYVKYWF